MSNKLFKNLVTSIFTYGLAFGISFFLSPYITKQLGVEANGFVTLANQFVGYIALITVALTSMASRFISVNIYRNDFEKANTYYNSVLGASAILVTVISLIVGPLICNLEKIINISPRLIWDVKVLFFVVFLNFCLGLLFEVFTIATYVSNRLYLSSIRSIEGNIIRCCFIILAYTCFETKMYYISVAAMVSALYTYLWNIHYTRKYLPQLCIRIKYFKKEAIVELLSAGSWNIVIQLNNILNTGLDLLLSNWILGESSMGILAVAKTIPTSISTMLNSVSGVFLPEMTQAYAENNMERFVVIVRRSIKILALIFNIPVVFLIVYGGDFYRLWQPSLPNRMLQILSLLTICTILVSGSTAAVFGIFTITNRLKYHSITSVVFGVINTVVVIILLNFVPTEHGVYVVAGISSLLITLRNYAITFPYAAKCISQKWYIFHLPSFKTIFGVAISSLLCFGIRFLFIPKEWFTLFLSGVLVVFVSIIINTFIVLQKEDREYLCEIIKKKIVHK